MEIKLDNPDLNIGNIAQGAVPEIFDKAVSQVIRNMADPSTPAEQKREISLKVTFSPFRDRSGAEVQVSVKSSLASIEPASGTIHISKMSGSLKGYAHDPRQERMFEPPASDKIS